MFFRKHPLTVTRAFGRLPHAFDRPADAVSTFIKIGSRMCEAKFTSGKGY